MALHIPVNHPLRQLYRVLAGLTGLYVLALGVIGLIRTSGLEPFQQANLPWVLGLRVNPAFAVLSIVMGAVIVVGTVIGRNIDHLTYLAAGTIFLVAGLVMMTLLRTEVNFLGFSMANCIASFIFGLVVLTAGLYGKVGTPEAAEAENAFRHR